MSFFLEISLKLMCLTKYTTLPGPDPGFSVGGAWTHSGGVWPPTWALFSENVCENKRIGSCRRTPPLDPPMLTKLLKLSSYFVGVLMDDKPRTINQCDVSAIIPLHGDGSKQTEMYYPSKA